MDTTKSESDFKTTHSASIQMVKSGLSHVLHGKKIL